ncbi:MAG: N-methylhydantoinase B [Halioglobus sp.]|jgi:N-methylhydantoinase B
MTNINDYVLGPSIADRKELARPLAVDPIIFEIIRNKFQAINEEQALALKEVSVSPIVAGAGDFNNALFTADGRLASMGPQVVFHSGAMPLILKHVMEDFADEEICDGDMYIVNDPYKGAVHHPDVTIMAPIFFEGKLVSWAGVTAHQVDMGGMSVGSVSVRAKEKQQEGLMMPPMLLIEKGKMRKDVWRMIMNMTRQPQMVGLDLKGFIASNVVARERLTELMEQYGVETILTVMEELIRYSERKTREHLASLPDGEVRTRGYLDHDGTENKIYKTDVKITKEGDKLTIDMSDSSPQAYGYINCAEGCLIGAVLGGVAPLLGSGIPWNQGILNSIEVIAPKGLICNANSPAATGAATIGQGWVITLTTAHAISKLLALSEKSRKHSQGVTHGTMAALFTGDTNQHGEPFGNQLIDAQIGGGGANPFADGIDQAGCFVSPRPHIPNIEYNEMHSPMLFLYRSFFPDTGGDGEHRGGRAAGTAWTPHGVERLRCSLTSHGVEVPISYGQFGAYPGVCSNAMIIHDSDVAQKYAESDLPLNLEDIAAPMDLDALGGKVQILAAKQDELPLMPGDVVQYTWQGGGGYGDPLERKVEDVIVDLKLAYISAQRAEKIYGVRADDAAEETARRRDSMRKARLDNSDSPSKKSSKIEKAENRATLSRFGAGMLLTQSPASSLQFECECGCVFCNAVENWKEHVAYHSLSNEELPEGVRLHTTMELVEYLCPDCGRRHALDVKERGIAPLHDLKITKWVEELA